MGRETVIAVALLCLSVAVLDLHGVKGRMVPSRVLYTDLPRCTGKPGEVPGITCSTVPLSLTAANGENAHTDFAEECKPRSGYVPPERCFWPPAAAYMEAARTEDEDCQTKPGHLPPIHCQDPPKHY